MERYWFLLLVLWSFSCFVFMGLGGLMLGYFISQSGKPKKVHLRLGFSKRDKEVCQMEVGMFNTEVGILTIEALGKNEQVLGIEPGTLVVSAVSGDAVAVVLDDSHVEITPVDATIQTVVIQGTVDADKGPGVVTLAWELTVNVSEEMASHVGLKFETRPK
jgi:hypothetical protein